MENKKTFICKCLPNGLEFGAVVKAETELEAKQKIKTKVEADGWTVTLDDIQLIELIDDTIIVDSLDEYKKINRD